MFTTKQIVLVFLEQRQKLVDELELQKHLNVSLRKVVTRTLERFLNLRCPAVSDLLRFRFFIQLRSQSDARVM